MPYLRHACVYMYIAVVLLWSVMLTMHSTGSTLCTYGHQNPTFIINWGIWGVRHRLSHINLILKINSKIDIIFDCPLVGSSRMSQSDTPLQPPLDDKVTTMTSHLEIDNTDLVDGPHVSQTSFNHCRKIKSHPHWLQVLRWADLN